MRASLTMYSRLELRKANANFWSLIRDNLRSSNIHAPNVLCNGHGVEFWSAPDLIFSQTCSLPYRSALHKKVQIIGTPDYGVEGCMPGYYKSVLIRKKGDGRASLTDFHGGRIALNGLDSQSGFAAIANQTASTGTRFSGNVISGSHANSIKAVAAGQADIAALDAVTWKLATRYEAMANEVEVFSETDETPGLPFICALGLDRLAMFDAVSEAIEALDDTTRETLMIRGLVQIPTQRYLDVPTPKLADLVA